VLPSELPDRVASAGMVARRLWPILDLDLDLLLDLLLDLGLDLGLALPGRKNTPVFDPIGLWTGCNRATPFYTKWYTAFGEKRFLACCTVFRNPLFLNVLRRSETR
jgi:hypothetical protein